MKITEKLQGYLTWYKHSPSIITCFWDCAHGRVILSFENSDSILVIVPLFCLAFLVYMFCGSCTEGMCHFSIGVNVFIVTNFVWKWIWRIGNWYCLLDIRFVDDQCLVEIFACCLFTIQSRYLNKLLFLGSSGVKLFYTQLDAQFHGLANIQFVIHITYLSPLHIGMYEVFQYNICMINNDNMQCERIWWP